jgi:hypothetical protein
MPKRSVRTSNIYNYYKELETIRVLSLSIPVPVIGGI